MSVKDAHFAKRYSRLHALIPEGGRWMCGYGARREASRCGSEAVWHGAVLDEGRTELIAMMECCDEHRPVMEAIADFVHELDSACGVPGSRFTWPENICYLPETDGALEAMRRSEAPCPAS